MNLFDFAFALLIHYYRTQDSSATRGERAVHTAKFDGMCVAADRLGLTMTPMHCWSIVHDAVEAAGLRPHYSAANNSVQQEFDNAIARVIVKELEN